MRSRIILLIRDVMNGEQIVVGFKRFFSKTRRQNLKTPAGLFQFNITTCVRNALYHALFLTLQCTYMVIVNETRPLYLGFNQS